MFRLRHIMIATLALPFLGACSEPVTPPVTTLSARQAQQMVTALLNEVAAATAAAHGDPDAALVAAGGAASAAGAAAEEYSFDTSCRGGGRIHGSGDAWTLLSPNGTGTQSMNLLYTPVGCVIDAGGLELVVDGDPSLTYDWSASYTNNVRVGDILFNGRGSIRWSGDRTGSCLVDYTITIPPGGTGIMSGIMCGQDIGGPL
ncbi:MAG: hypothetical protein WEF86_04295 [Gemmatimonadota bacterium]